MFAQQIINGLTLGSIYALFALGYTMVYGVLLMINFAHSEIFMVGAYIGFWVLALLPGVLPPIIPLYFLIIFGFALLFTGVLAVAVERMAYRPLRHAPRLAPLISAIGVSIFLQNLDHADGRRGIATVSRDIWRHPVRVLRPPCQFAADPDLHAVDRSDGRCSSCSSRAPKWERRCGPSRKIISSRN